MKEGFFIIILILMFFIFTSVMIYFYLKTPYFCDVGEINIIGDYKTEPNTFFNNRFCAIKDCSIFNNYQKSIGGDELCVV